MFLITFVAESLRHPPWRAIVSGCVDILAIESLVDIWILFP
jgi:hypothetical protein